jgi:hypothetical protein
MFQIDAKELHAAFSQGDCNKIAKEIATKCAGKLVGRGHDRDGYFPKWTILGLAEDSEMQLGIHPPHQRDVRTRFLSHISNALGLTLSYHRILIILMRIMGFVVGCTHPRDFKNI